MSGNAHAVLEQAKKLTAEERIELARELLASVDEDEETGTPEEIEAAWDDEIRRRDEQVLGGAGGAHDAEDVLAEAEHIIRSPRLPSRFLRRRADGVQPPRPRGTSAGNSSDACHVPSRADSWPRYPVAARRATARRRSCCFLRCGIAAMDLIEYQRARARVARTDCR
jgi:hypothetical protein